MYTALPEGSSPASSSSLRLVDPTAMPANCPAPRLASPLRLPCGVVAPNRIAKASMSEALADAEGRPTEALATLYRRWARGGVGLVLTGNAVTHGDHVERPGNVIAEDERVLPGLSRWAEAASSGGAPAILQIGHAGRQTPRFVNGAPLAPSEVAAVKFFRAFGEPRAATREEIADIARGFVRIARYAETAGFAGVQIHAAHGYLLNQFLSPKTNLRTDGYGGDLAGRARLLLEIVRAVRAAVRPGTAVSVKLNTADFQEGAFSEDEAAEVVRLLADEGIDLLELSGGTYERGASLGDGVTLSPREAYFLEFAARARSLTRVPLLVTGGFRSQAAMERALADDATDLVGLGRPLALEPDLPRRLLEEPGARSRSAPVRFVVPKLRGLVEMAWYWRQLVRMSRGLEPDPSLSLGASLVHRLVADYVGARRLVRARRRAARSALAGATQAPKTMARAVAAPLPSGSKVA